MAVTINTAVKTPAPVAKKAEAPRVIPELALSRGRQRFHSMALGKSFEQGTPILPASVEEADQLLALRDEGEPVFFVKGTEPAKRDPNDKAPVNYVDLSRAKVAAIDNADGLSFGPPKAATEGTQLPAGETIPPGVVSESAPAATADSKPPSSSETPEAL